ncbi:beta-ketoacyl-ACP synthase III [Flavobacterium sp. ov086]|uniref:beta-ketoacyl-ACP synthase III n=1 Tax=Flavobacterium sp. ov086 TaxID=1761785 RepID=UPI000B728E7C|nr:beta-ketoacyl-ACP synthase III [Flavobacterium sp. ov086]SNR38892.1 3-oxoacyl-[acyl-carrier-protein] synthase-3 [Flavobacterium sp. ov086]
MNTINASIIAIGGYVPETVLSNTDLEKMVDTSDEWITSRTGIKERRILDDPTLATSDMAAFAVKDLIKNYAIDPLDVDCIILATSTPDRILTPAASLVCEKAGLKNAWGFDLNSACSGFLYALSVGASFIESGRYKNVIVIGADKMSSIVNYEDRNSCILFGDGAGAVLLRPNTEGRGIQQNIFRTDGTGAEYLTVRAGGSLLSTSKETIHNKQHFVQQEGRTVFKQAVKNMSATSKELMEKASLTPEMVDWVIPHQANLRIIQAVSEDIGIGIDKFKINIQRYGNTTAATIPLCLWDFKNDFKKGDNIIVTAFGAGFSWGSMHIKW